MTSAKPKKRNGPQRTAWCRQKPVGISLSGWYKRRRRAREFASQMAWLDHLIERSAASDQKPTEKTTATPTEKTT